jgi:hypothetical protein
MVRRHARARFASLLLLLVGVCVGASALGLEAVTVGFAEAWTGNAYVGTPDDPGGEYDFDVTGSEPFQVDPFARVGVRFGLVDGFIAPGAVLVVAPAVEIGWRRYVLFDSGRVAPAQIETATGAEGSVLGVGSARVLTLRLPLPVSYDQRFANGNAVFMSLSPSLVFRIPVGQVELRDEDSDLSGMTDFFYDRMRFLMPEIAVGYRFALSDYLDASIHLTYGVSLLDLFDSTLPWYDQTRLAIGIDLGLVPPFGGLARDREAEQQLPEGIDPFPEDDEADEAR